jgi:hypothetical protein
MTLWGSAENVLDELRVPEHSGRQVKVHATWPGDPKSLAVERGLADLRPRQVDASDTQSPG